MRQLVAAFGFLAFANLSLLQASGFCPLAGRHAQRPAATASAHHGEHADHGAVTASGTEAINDAPVPDQGHPLCLMMGPCGLSVEVGRVVTTASFPHHTDGVHAGSDPAPRSLTTSPELPPPRA